jgi:hypothetical protein
MEIFDEDSIDVNLTLNNIALCNAQIGYYEKALKLYKKCRRNFSKHYGKNSIEVMKI